MLTTSNSLFRPLAFRHSLQPLVLQLMHNNVKNHQNDIQPSTPMPWYRRCLEKFNLYAMTPSSTAAFHSIIVKSAYKTDKVDTSKWTLTYYDFDASRIGYIAVGSIAGLTIFGGLACFDFFSNEQFTLPPILRFINDATELGCLTVVPITLILIVSAILLRLHSMRVFRIYQSLENPDNFFIILPGFVRMYRQRNLIRADILVRDELYESDSFHKLLVFGNAKLGSNPVLLNIDAFKSFVHKSYFLNENNTLPPEFHKAERSLRASKKLPIRSSSVPPAPPPF